MSRNTIIWIVVAIVVILIIWWWWGGDAEPEVALTIENPVALATA